MESKSPFTPDSNNAKQLYAKRLLAFYDRFRWPFGWRFFFGTSVVGYAGYSLLKYNVEKHFEEVFSGVSPAKCYDREEDKKIIENALNSENPAGVLLITGKINSGKTTLISHTISKRKYVAAMNWRNLMLTRPSDLNDELRRSFRMEGWWDFMSGIPGKIISSLFTWVPSLPESIREIVRNERKDLIPLITTLEEIKEFLRAVDRLNHRKILKQQKPERPVIFIDSLVLCDHY